MRVSVKVDGHTYDVEIPDLNKRPITAIVDGETFEIYPESEPTAAFHPSEPSTISAPVVMSVPVSPATSGNAMLAPLPGTITEIFVLPGAKVETGQPVCVIEAMKMKNTIRADRSGTVANVPIVPGQSVKHKQLLVEFGE